MCGTILDTSQVLLSITVLSLLAAVLSEERDGVTGNNVGSLGLVIVLSYRDNRICIWLPNKCTI